jgi:Lipocalin-like domain
MKPAVLKVLAIIILFTAAASCKKSNADTTAAPKSKTILLTQASWKIQSVSQDTNKDNVGDLDVTTAIKACQLDNTYTFKTDNTGSMDEAAAKCTSTDPQTTTFTWVFKNTETILSGTFSFTNGDATIISMNDTNLVVAYDDVVGATTYHFIATLKH